MCEHESLRLRAHFLYFDKKRSDTCCFCSESVRALKTRFLCSNCVLCTHNSLYAHALDIHSFHTFLLLTFSVHIFYHMQCECSDPLTWALKKICITDRACEPGLAQAYAQSVLFSCTIQERFIQTGSDSNTKRAVYNN